MRWSCMDLLLGAVESLMDKDFRNKFSFEITDNLVEVAMSYRLNMHEVIRVWTPYPMTYLLFFFFPVMHWKNNVYW